MKKLLTYFLLLFIILFSFGNNTFGYGNFTQTSDPQNSTNAVDGDVVDAIGWNSMVYDIANIIVDIGNLKDYIDSNLVTFFKDDGTSLTYTDKNVYLGKNLSVDGKTTTNTITINPGTLNQDVIISDDIKNGSLLQEDLDPNIDYGQDVIWVKSGPNLYYKAGNIAIGDITADEKLEITNGSLKINGAGHGIKFADGSFLTSKPLPSTDDVLTKTNQEIDGVKTFKEGLILPNKDTGNIFNYPIDYSSSDSLTGNRKYIKASNTIEEYYVISSGSNSGALFDRHVTMNNKPTLKLHINEGKYVEVKLNARGYHHQLGETPHLLPNTTYFTRVMVKSSLTGDSYGAQVRILNHDQDGNPTAEYSLTPKIIASQDWTIYETTFTTKSNTYSSHLEFRIYGHTGAKTLHGDVWFDVNNMVIKPISNNENGEIKKVSNIIDNNVNQVEDTKTLVTEKAINDYLGTKVTKLDGECSALKSRILWKAPNNGLCDVGTPSLVTANSDDTYSWTCSGLNGGNSVNCRTQVCTPNNVTETYTETTTSTQNKTTTVSDIKGTGTRGSSNNNRYTQEFVIPNGVTKVKVKAKLERNEEPCCDRSTFYIYKNGSNIKTYGSYSNRGSVNIAYDVNVQSGDKLKLRLNKRHDGSVNRGDSYIKNVQFVYTQNVTNTITKTRTIDKNYCATKGVKLYTISGNLTSDAKGLKIIGCGGRETTVQNDGSFKFENIPAGTNCSDITFKITTTQTKFIYSGNSNKRGTYWQKWLNDNTSTSEYVYIGPSTSNPYYRFKRSNNSSRYGNGWPNASIPINLSSAAWSTNGGSSWSRGGYGSGTKNGRYSRSDRNSNGFTYLNFYTNGTRGANCGNRQMILSSGKLCKPNNGGWDSVNENWYAWTNKITTTDIRGCKIITNGSSNVDDDDNSITGKCENTYDVRGGKIFAIKISGTNITRQGRIDACQTKGGKVAIMANNGQTFNGTYWRNANLTNGNAFFQNGACRGNNDSNTTTMLNKIIDTNDTQANVFIYGCGTSNNLTTGRARRRESKYVRSGSSWNRTYNNNQRGYNQYNFATSGTSGHTYILCIK